MAITEIFGNQQLLSVPVHNVEFKSAGAQNAGTWSSAQPTRITLLAPGNYWFGSEICFVLHSPVAKLEAGVFLNRANWLCSQVWANPPMGQELWLKVISPTQARAARDYLEIRFETPNNTMIGEIIVWNDPNSSATLYPHFASNRIS